ncbi:transcriptional regulator [Xenorhabdus kozodoii]|uniref:Transcriptional regulator n=1 Tax=Xenorhabdus kozodoii TaxID=351676 RepID=A0A2D0LC43_9GAMM|nr:transcriptional regulator [Xenorhabdus kozodoii]
MNNNNVQNDWHQADIIAALRKRGTTLAAVSREAGLSSSTLANALSRQWPKGEWIIRIISASIPQKSGRVVILICTDD